MLLVRDVSRRRTVPVEVESDVCRASCRGRVSDARDAPGARAAPGTGPSRASEFSTDPELIEQDAPLRAELVVADASRNGVDRTGHVLGCVDGLVDDPSVDPRPDAICCLR